MKAPGQRFVSEVQDSPLLFPLAVWMDDLVLAPASPLPGAQPASHVGLSFPQVTAPRRGSPTHLQFLFPWLHFHISEFLLLARPLGEPDFSRRFSRTAVSQDGWGRCRLCHAAWKAVACCPSSVSPPGGSKTLQRLNRALSERV